MNLRKIVMNMRVNHEIKGKYPVVVFTMPNKGGVHNGSRRYYVMTYRKNENELYFHGLTKLFHKYNSKFDFSLNLSKFSKYTQEAATRLGGGRFSLISYRNDYFPVGFFVGSYDSKEGENNLEYIFEELKNSGLEYTNVLESVYKKEATNEKKAK